VSRVGKQVIQLPKTVKARFEDSVLRVEGPKGSLSHRVVKGIEVSIDGDHITVKRQDNERQSRSLHGLTRSLIANMVAGVEKGFQRELEIVGVGYRAELKGSTLRFALGYSHPVEFALPEGVTAKVDRQTRIVLEGPDKHIVGLTAAKIRSLRKPEPYKGKGIRYVGEVVRRKVGKAGVGVK
jgi:large subunit ribosomal protein L6